MADEKLRGIVQYMIDNGESDEFINQVIAEHKRRNAVKTKTAVDTDVAVEEPPVEVTPPPASPHITYDELIKTDAGLLDRAGKFGVGNKEENMVKNLEKHYEGEGFTFEFQDEWGWNDKIIATDQNGNNVSINWTDVNAWVDPNEYKYKRENEYPTIEDQLDDIYHNGIDAWKATIKVTKDKYPKSA